MSDGRQYGQSPSGNGSPLQPSNHDKPMGGLQSIEPMYGSVPCTNGALLTSVPDLAGSTNSAGANPVYTTGAVNGLPAFTFTNNGDQIFFTAGAAANWAVTGQITFYAILKPISSATELPMLPLLLMAVQWRINTTGKQEILSQGTTSIGSGTATISTSAYSTLTMTYDYTSHVLNLYTCAGGTCSSDGTATTSASFSSQQSVLGWAGPITEQFKGSIAEWGYLTSADITGIAAWSQCKYGI